MFERTIDFPCAVADQDGVGEYTALKWCASQLHSGETLTLWVSQKGILRNNAFLARLSNDQTVNIVTGRGYGFYVADGPVLAMYPRVDELGTIVSAAGITALCVVRWSDRLTVWSREVNAEILHDAGFDYPDAPNVDLSPTVTEALKSMTFEINHNNTIAAGYEKKVVVRHLLSLHDDGDPLSRQGMMEWVAAHGWSGSNVKEFGNLIDKISNGVTPRVMR